MVKFSKVQLDGRFGFSCTCGTWRSGCASNRCFCGGARLNVPGRKKRAFPLRWNYNLSYLASLMQILSVGLLSIAHPYYFPPLSWEGEPQLWEELIRKSLPDGVDWRGKNSLGNQPCYKMANARVEWQTVHMHSIYWNLCGRWLIEFGAVIYVLVTISCNVITNGFPFAFYLFVE